jgi:aminoglycoside phosphotransferase (APT) family kinase protein
VLGVSVPPPGAAAAASAAVLREVNLAHAGTYQLVRPLQGGRQSGAWLIADGEGREAVLKWTSDPTWATQIQRASRAIPRIRSAGYPTPAWLAVGITRRGQGYQVQEHLRGAPREQLTEETARRLIEVLELHADLDPDPGRSWSDHLAASVSGKRASMSAEVASTGPGGVRLAAAAAEVVSGHGIPSIPRNDLVHGDFRLANIVFADDVVHGVVDIEALGSGTRVFDYATLLDHDHAEDAAVELLVAAGSQVAGPAVLAQCLAHVVLDLAQFMRRHQPPDPIDRVDGRARSLADRVSLVSRLLT